MRILYLSLVVVFVGSIAEAKVPTVAVILRFEDKYNNSLLELNKGISSAERVFKSRHPKIKFVLKRYSHGDSVESIVSAAQTASLEKVVAVIGGELSTEAEVMARVFQENQVAMISPTATNPALTKFRSFIFRACSSDEQVAAKLADFVLTKLSAKKIAVVSNISYSYSRYLGQQFYKIAKDTKNVQILHEVFVSKQNDFRVIIQRLKSAKISHVVMLNYYSDLLAFYSQAADLGYFPTYVGSDGWGAPARVFEKLVNGGANGARFVGYQNSYWGGASEGALAEDFSADFALHNNSKPNEWNATAFDAAWIVFAALQAAKTGSAQDVRDRIKATRGLRLTTTESFHFNEVNTPTKKLHLNKISKQGIEYMGQY